jgi:hypothetical protein
MTTLRPKESPQPTRSTAMKFLHLSSFGVMLLLQGCPVSPFDRMGEFQAHAKAGEPLIQALEAFRKDTGHYPASLTELAPKYLPEVAPESHDQHKFGDWEYLTETNGERVSYSLYYFMGKGAVQYQPTNWTANDDGHVRPISMGGR